MPVQRAVGGFGGRTGHIPRHVGGARLRDGRERDCWGEQDGVGSGFGFLWHVGMSL